MAITTGIIAAVGIAASVGTTAYALSKGSPDVPKVPDVPPPPAPPPPPPPVPAPPPKPPTETDTGTAVADERRKRATRFGVQDTLLTSPLGAGSRDTPPGKSLLGG